MIIDKKINIIIVILALIFLPDIILSYSGRDTFFVHKINLLITTGRLCILFAVVIFFVELVGAAVKKKWKKVVGYCSVAALLFLSVDQSINYLAKQSSGEAINIVHSFIDSKGLGIDFDVSIEDEVKQQYEKYMGEEFDAASVKLEWFSSSHRRYEFKVSPKDAQPFIITLNTSQLGAPEIWVHK